MRCAGCAIGLVGFSVYLLRSAGCTHTTTRAARSSSALFQNGINIALAIPFVEVVGRCSVSASRSVSPYLICAAWVLLILSYKVPGFPADDILRRIWPMALSAIVMAEVVYLVTRASAATAASAPSPG